MQPEHKRRFPKKYHPPVSKYVPGEIKVLDVDEQHAYKFNLNTFFGNTSLQNLSIRFDPDGSLIALANQDGEVKVYNVYDSKNQAAVKTWKSHLEATTSVRWRPGTDSHNAFVTTCADGSVTWFRASGEVKTRTTNEEFALLCCDIAADGSYLAVGTNLGDVLLYDQNTHQVMKRYPANTPDTINSNHTNRVFCVKTLPASVGSHLFITGGWDSRVMVWDTRMDEPVRCIHGPNISGESIDYKTNRILTGSYRNDQILQLWDFRSGELIETVKTDFKEHEAAYCYTAAFSQHAPLMVLGTSGNNQVHFYDTKDKNRLVGKLQMQAPCFSVDFSASNNLFACTGAEGVVYVFTVAAKSQ